jgi:hypothetical protein
MGGRRLQTQFVEHAATLGINAEVVPRNTGTRGFHAVKRRWVVERSLGWLMLHRRLVRDYETLPASSEAMIHIAMIDNISRRITDEATPTWRGTTSRSSTNRMPSQIPRSPARTCLTGLHGYFCDSPRAVTDPAF